MPTSHSSRALCESLRDSHIPTVSTTGNISFRTHSTRPCHRKGLLTDVSGPQRNGSPGTLRNLVESPDIRDQIGGCGVEKIARLHDDTSFALGTHDSSRSVRLICV